MAIQRILGTDSGKKAFEKTDSNFQEVSQQIDNLSNVKQVEIAKSFLKDNTEDVVFDLLSIPAHSLSILLSHSLASSAISMAIVFYANSPQYRFVLKEPTNCTVVFDSENKKIVIKPQVTNWTRYCLLSAY